MGFAQLFGRKKQQSPGVPDAATSWTANLGGEVRSPAASVGGTGFAVLDFETTGLSPKVNRVVQIAIVTTGPEGEVVSRWSTLVNPDGPMEATHIHGITNDDVRAAPKFKDVADELRERLSGLALSAHNMRFDASFLEAEYLRLGWAVPRVPALCTYEESVYFLPDLGARKLVDCCRVLGITPGRHDALSDATATSALMAYYLDIARRDGVRPELLLYPDTAAGISWPTMPTLQPSLNMEAQRHKRIELATTHPRRTSASLISSLQKVSLDALLWDDAPVGSLEFLDLVGRVIEDGVVTDEEARQLSDLAEAFGLDSATSDRLMERLLSILAAQAWSDGFLSRDEQAELKHLVQALDLPERLSPKLLKAAELQRQTELSADLAPLPADWNFGLPLRVGQRVAFTGCEWEQRERLESECVARGCRLTGSVSGKTDLLVTDGSYAGNKLEAAANLGTRVVHPDHFEELVKHIQPANAG